MLFLDYKVNIQILIWLKKAAMYHVTQYVYVFEKLKDS